MSGKTYLDEIMFQERIFIITSSQTSSN